MPPSGQCIDESAIGPRDSRREVTSNSGGSRIARAPRVLCVDDNVACLRLLREVLVRGGCQVDCVSGGSEAAARLAGMESFDFLITDHDMPGMTGLMLVEKLRGTSFAGKIVVTSASVGRVEEDAYRAQGVTDILLKPFFPTALLRIVRGP